MTHYVYNRALALRKGALLAALVFCFCLSATAQEEKRLSICGTEVTKANAKDVLGDGGSVSYDFATQELVLNNVAQHDLYTYAIESYFSLKSITVKGNNVFYGPYGGDIFLRVNDGDEVVIQGESLDDKLTIFGLSMTVPWNYDWEDWSNPPISGYKLTIRDCSLKVYKDGIEAGNHGSVAIDNASVKTRGMQYVKHLTLSDGLKIMNPYKAFFSEELRAVTLDGAAAYMDYISIGSYRESMVENAIVVHKLDGSTLAFAFADEPVISYTASDLVLTSGGVTVEFPLASLRKISVEGRWDVVTGVEATPAPDREVLLSPDGASVRGEVPGSPFYVYDLRGVLQARGTINAEGRADLPLTGLPSGVYVVRTSGSAFKVRIR